MYGNGTSIFKGLSKQKEYMENNMTRITEIKAQIEAGGEGCVPYGSLSELLGLVIAQNEALKKFINHDDCNCIVDCHSCVDGFQSNELLEVIGDVKAALAQFKAWNEVV